MKIEMKFMHDKKTQMKIGSSYKQKDFCGRF